MGNIFTRFAPTISVAVEVLKRAIKSVSICLNSNACQYVDMNLGFIHLDSNISVMILHRPGCEILDKLVRDFSFVIHSYGIDVNSPLLEMSQIDAEGGIATYIQRNIDTCTYILIIVTDNVTGDF